MTLRFTETSDAIVVFLTGVEVFDDTEVREGHLQLHDLCQLAVSGAKTVIVDLSPFELMSSTTLALLLRFHNTSLKYSVNLRITNAGPNIRELLSIMQLDKIFRFDDDGPDLFGATVPLPKPPTASGGRAEWNQE